jgi:hypothetical protein
MSTKALLWAILIVFLVILLVHIPFLFYTNTKSPQHPRVVVEKEYPSAYWQIAYPNYWEWQAEPAYSQRPITSSERYWEWGQSPGYSYWPSGWYGSPWYYGGSGGTYSGGIRTHSGHPGGHYGGHGGHR